MYSLAGDAGLGDALGVWEFVIRAITHHHRHHGSNASCFLLLTCRYQSSPCFFEFLLGTKHIPPYACQRCAHQTRPEAQYLRHIAGQVTSIPDAGSVCSKTAVGERSPSPLLSKKLEQSPLLKVHAGDLRGISSQDEAERLGLEDS